MADFINLSNLVLFQIFGFLPLQAKLSFSKVNKKTRKIFKNALISYNSQLGSRFDPHNEIASCNFSINYSIISGNPSIYEHSRVMQTLDLRCLIDAKCSYKFIEIIMTKESRIEFSVNFIEKTPEKLKIARYLLDNFEFKFTKNIMRDLLLFLDNPVLFKSTNLKVDIYNAVAFDSKNILQDLYPTFNNSEKYYLALLTKDISIVDDIVKNGFTIRFDTLDAMWNYHCFDMFDKYIKTINDFHVREGCINYFEVLYGLVKEYPYKTIEIINSAESVIRYISVDDAGLLVDLVHSKTCEEFSSDFMNVFVELTEFVNVPVCKHLVLGKFRSDWWCDSFMFRYDPVIFKQWVEEFLKNDSSDLLQEVILQEMESFPKICYKNFHKNMIYFDEICGLSIYRNLLNIKPDYHGLNYVSGKSGKITVEINDFDEIHIQIVEKNNYKSSCIVINEENYKFYD